MNTVEWTPEDTRYAVALELYESRLCSGCGGDLAETTQLDNMYRYVADDPTRCHKCTALHIAQEAHSDRPQPGALMWSAHLPIESP